MANSWFRLYAEFVNDPKVQRLSEKDQRRYIMLLCLRCSNGDVTLHDDDVTFSLRISDAEWNDSKAILTERKLIDKNNKPIAWEKRQFSSDSSAERVSRHRMNKKIASNGDVTLQQRKCNVLDTDTDTDTDTESLKPNKTLKPRKTLKDPAAPKDAATQETNFQVACKKTWAAYNDAYFNRYGTEPVRNASVNSQVKSFVKRLGQEEAPHVAGFYVRSNSSFYVQRLHSFGNLVTDAEKVRTEWATGRSMTATRAKQIDKTQANSSVVEEALALMVDNYAKTA